MAFENIEWVYSNSACNTVRYVLGKKTSNTIACIGINPSTASPNDLDNTLKSVKRIAAFNGYDGWVMYNLYPQRSTDPSLLDKEVNHHLRLKNSYAIKQSILELKIDTIWLAFGNLIESRTYLSLCMLSIHENLKDLNLNWKIIGVPTKKRTSCSSVI